MKETKAALNARLLRGVPAVAAVLLFSGAFRLFSLQFSPGGALLLFLLPLPELLLAALYLLRCRNGLSRLETGAASLILGMLLVWNLGETFYRYFYRENFDLLRDIRLLPGLAAMLSGLDLFMRPAGVLMLMLASVVLALALGLLILRLLRTGIAPMQQLGRIGRRRTAWILLLLCAGQLIFALNEVPAARIILRGIERVRWSSEPLSSPVTRQEEDLFSSAAPSAGTEALPSQSSPGSHYRFPGIKDGDVHLFIVESYGHTLFTKEEHREPMMPVYAVLEDELESRGWHIRSGFLRSPAFGGRSWLADATMLTGVQVTDQQIYDELPLSGERNLTHIFEDAGYYRLMAAPGTRQADDRWRNFYRFSRYLFRYDFGYEGPFVSFGAMPDQYLLYRSGELLKGVGEPVFAVYTLVSTHVPFEVIPEYIPDWERLGNGAIYGEGNLRTYDNNWLSGREYPEGFIAGVEYSLKSIAGYLERYAADNSLAIIIGDHQPRIPVSERDSTYSVPVHFLSRNGEILKRIPGEHFTPGLVPEGVPDEHLPMARLPSLLLNMIEDSEGQGFLNTRKR
jgi:Sulfatase